MIVRFKQILYGEILAMMMSQKRDRAPSRQSISNMSTGSRTDEYPLSSPSQNKRAIFNSLDDSELYREGEGPDEEQLDEELDEESDEESDEQPDEQL